MNPRSSSIRLRTAAWILAVLAMAGSHGCAGRSHALIPQTLSDELYPSLPAVAWFAPEAPGDRVTLGRWRSSVGPPVVLQAAAPPARSDRLVVVSWNQHVGGGDFRRLFADVRREAGPGVPIVVLLQEAYRDGPDVPGALDGQRSFASAIRAIRKDGRRDEIEAVAASLGLHAYYAPSMRNGGPVETSEDRGNAILSTVPLVDLAAIELPFESQRRVAVAATVAGSTATGEPWRLRVVSAHLDNMAGLRRLWIAGSEHARARQARGLVSALGRESPLVVGADLNSWFGFRDLAFSEMVRSFPHTRTTDRRPTFRGLLRLDHLFFRLQSGWSAAFRRADDSYESDHYPLIGVIRFTGDVSSTEAPPPSPCAGYNQVLTPWASPQALLSARTAWFRSWVRAAWAKSTARTTRGCRAKSR